MTPKQSIRIYIAECALHTKTLDKGLADARLWTPLPSGVLIEDTMLRILQDHVDAQ